MNTISNNFKITSDGDLNTLKLRPANENDLENLRNWKNEQRKFFFHKDIITLEQQYAWFAEFQARNHDYIFVVDINSIAIGCIGIRLLDGMWDVYNVILGLSDYGKKGYMSQALQTTLAYAKSVKNYPIKLQVLKANPAVSWYKKNGFLITTDNADHYSMVYQNNTL